MKILVIPDVHLKPWMFVRASELMKETEADRAVCLMDIADDWRQQFNLDLYVLGDFAYRNRTSIADYTSQMNGFIHLIRGNHDKRSEAYNIGAMWHVLVYKGMLQWSIPCRIMSHRHLRRSLPDREERSRLYRKL